MGTRLFDIPGFQPKRNRISIDDELPTMTNDYEDTLQYCEDSFQGDNTSSQEEVSIMDSLLDNVVNCNKIFKEDENKTSTLDDFIYICWCELRISKEHIKQLYELANNIIKLVAPQHELLYIPKSGQDIVRKYCSSNNEIPIHKNLYICRNCTKLLGFNGGRNLLEQEKIQCSNEECGPNTGIKTSIIPLIPRIRKFLSSKKFINEISYYSKEQIIQYLSMPVESLPSKLPAYMSGKNYRQYMSKVINNGDIFLTFDMTCDGISVFTNPLSQINQSSFPILLKLLNYNYNRISDNRSFWVYSVTKESYSNTILTLLIKEFSILSSGIEMDIYIDNRIIKKKVVGVLLNVFGDCAAVSTIGGFSGSSSSFPCRYCELNWNRSTSEFHQGIKCTYQSIENYITVDTNNKSIKRILYPSCSLNSSQDNNAYNTNQPNDSNNSSIQILTKSIPSSYIYNDALTKISYLQRTNSSILLNRYSNGESGSTNGIKQVPSVFESLTYFDSATSFILDPMHLFNNVCTLLLCLLFHYNAKDNYSKISKEGIDPSESLIEKLCFDKENMSIITTRVSAVNTLYNNHEYEFRYIMNEKKFWRMSSHSRIFFTSCILPLITADFYYTDSPLVILIDPLATIIRQIYCFKGNSSPQNLEVFKNQCNIICFLFELLLPKELINTQIHYLKHLPETIINAGSIIYASTYESERFYSYLKRITFGRKQYNESCMRCIIEREIADIHINNKNIDSSNSNLSLEGNKETYDEVGIELNEDESFQNELTECFKEVHTNNERIKLIKGIRGIDSIDLSQSDIKEIIKLLLLSNDNHIKEVLWKDINSSKIANINSSINDPDIYRVLVNNLKNVVIAFYSEIMINDSIIFNSSDIDEGIETIDNSYIMYLTNDNEKKDIVHLIKALYYIQIGSSILIKKHEYPECHISSTGLYYIVEDSNRIIPKDNEYSSFIPVTCIEPDNLIIVDVHDDIHKNIDDSYEEKQAKKVKQKNKNVVSSEIVVTNTVFMTRHIT
ncbi:hypothetical protein WA158_002553 [Blastocystis sp. Blastoise]